MRVGPFLDLARTKKDDSNLPAHRFQFGRVSVEVAWSLTECDSIRRVVAACLLVASLVTLTSAAFQPVNSQAFTTATSTQHQTYMTFDYTTSTMPLTVFTLQFVSVTSFYTYVVVQFTTLTSFVTRTQIIYTTPRGPVNYPAPTLSGLSLQNDTSPRKTTFNACRADSTLVWRNTSYGFVEPQQIRCLV